MKKFADWMKETGYDQYSVAPLMECSQSTVSRVVAGKQDPTGSFIRAAFKISAGAVTPNSFFPDLFAEPVAEAAE